MSHENESPALPPSVTRAEPAEDLPFHPDTPGHVMSPGTRVPRPQTMVGIGSVPPPKGSVPPAPLTEVVPAPAVRNDPGLSAGVKAALDFAGVPRPRPSETHVGTTSPLHTAEDANTAVNLTSLSPADAGRILEAAEADKRLHPRPRAPTLLGTAAGLPPPPANRRPSTAPPPSSGPEPPTTRIGALPPPPGARSPYPHMHAQTITHGAPPPPAALRGSHPPAPPAAHRPNTLLFFDPIQEELAPKSSPVVPGDGRSVRAASARSAPGEAPKAPVRYPTVRAGPPPVAEAPEELSSALLADDSAQFPAIGLVPKQGSLHGIPPQPISSSSLVEDPDSDPDLQLEEDDDEAPTARPAAPPVAASSAPRVVPPDPLSSPFPDPPLPPPVIPPTPMSPVAPMVAADPFAPVERLAITEPMATRDPFTRPTDPPRLRDLRPDDSGRTYVAPPPGPLPLWSRPPVIIGSAVGIVTVAAVLAFAFRSSTPTSEQPSRVATSAASAASAPTSSASGEGTATAAPATSAAATAPHASESSGGSPCVLAGAPHVVAPHAIMKTGIETTSNPDRLAFGVGVNEHEGLIVAIDPSTFAITATAHPKTSDTLHRVVPLLGAGSELGSFLEASHHHATIESAYPVATEPPFVVGVAHGKLVWAASRTSTPEPLWSIDANVPVEVLRAIPLPKHTGYAVAFRQGTSLSLGALSEDKHINGPLVGIAGLGPQVGAPTLAAGNDHVVVAWADRTSPSVPWGIRWVKWHPGSDPGEPAPFPVPNAAEGAAEMSPSITSLSGGRFVMAWTEATGAAHVVRAEALDASEHPIGTTLTVSADGVNAGQGMPVFTPDGRGTVVFLASPTGATASVVAVPVICPGGA